MSFFRKYFAGEQKDSVVPHVSNLDAEQVKVIWETLQSNSKDGIIERAKFMELFSSLKPINEDIFAWIDRKNQKVTPAAVLRLIDSLFGDIEEIANTLFDIFTSISKLLSSLIDVATQRKKLPLEESQKLLRYFENDAPQDHARLGRWLHACPLALPIIRYVFAPLTFDTTSTLEMLPRLSVPSDLLKEGSIAVINANLPMERRLEWTMLFSTHRQGASFSQLSQKIDAQGPCLLVVKTKAGQVFGCFASEGFFTGPLYHGDATSFLFTAHPNIQISNATGHTNNYAYMNYQQQQMPNGIGIGGCADVWPFFLHEDFGEGECARHVSSFEKIDLCGEQQKFTIEAIEAWRCGEKPRPFNPDGDVPETPHGHKSVLDIDPQARALLEMGGRKMHSDAYREPQPMLDGEEYQPHHKKK